MGLKESLEMKAECQGGLGAFENKLCSFVLSYLPSLFRKRVSSLIEALKAPALSRALTIFFFSHFGQESPALSACMLDIRVLHHYPRHGSHEAMTRRQTAQVFLFCPSTHLRGHVYRFVLRFEAPLFHFTASASCIISRIIT